MASSEHPGLHAALWLLQQAGFTAEVSLGDTVTITTSHRDGRRFDASGHDLETALRNVLVLAGFDDE